MGVPKLDFFVCLPVSMWGVPIWKQVWWYSCEGKIAIETTTIDHYSSLKDWINEASDEKYWTALAPP